MGYGFNMVSCPNYLFEILGWTVISVMTNSIACMLVPLVLQHIIDLQRYSSHLPRYRYRHNGSLGPQEA